MRVSEYYTLQKLKGVDYLLPFGQNIAQHRRGIRLNETGVFLWEQLKKGPGRRQLLDAMTEYYEAGKEEIPLMERDLDAFLGELTGLGILEMEEMLPVPDCYFCIGGITLGFSGDKELLHSSLFDFSCQKREVQQHIIISGRDFCTETGKLLIRTDVMEVCESGDYYVVSFPSQVQLKGLRMSLDGRRVSLYIGGYTDREELKHQIFYAIRDTFLFLAQKSGLFALHSASLLYRDRAWLFSGPSGTGKSTHTNLWKKRYDLPLLNGDLNLCRAGEQGVTVYGMPWCGTSGIYTVKEYPLGGIVFLRQCSENRIEKLEEDEKQLNISQRLISPSWTEAMFRDNLQFAEKATENVLVFRLGCNMENAAAETSKSYIDKWIDRK